MRIASLVAGVGADLTQFEAGMNDADARLRQVASQAITTQHQVRNVREEAQKAAIAADAYRKRIEGYKRPINSADLARLDKRVLKSSRIAERADDMERDFAARAAVTQAYTNRLKENARESDARAFSTVGGMAGTAALALGAGMVVAVQHGSEYNKMLLTTVHNTSLGVEGTELFRNTIARLGQESGASLAGLAHGFQKIENFGFSAAQSVQILEVAMRSAVSAGASVSDTAELLAKSLVQFHLGADRANDAMNTMHVAASLSSLELQQLVQVGGQAYSMASNLGIGFVEANAALVVFTTQGLNASEAMTQFKNDIQKLVNPTSKVKKELADLTQKTGVDLAKAFSYTALKSRGMIGAFEDIRKAAKLGGFDPKQLANVLFPNMRGGVGAMIGVSDEGFVKFKKTINQLQDAMDGLADPTTKQYNEMLKDTNVTLDRVKNTAILLAGSLSESLTPILRGVADKLNSINTVIRSLTDAQKENIATTLILTTEFLGLFFVLSKLVSGYMALRTLLMTIGVTGAAFVAAVQPWLLVAAAISAAVAGLLYWKQVESDAAEATEKFNKQLLIESEQTLAVATAKRAHAETINHLVSRYTELSKNVKQTAEDKTRLQKILNAIAEKAPEYITAYDRMGNAVGLIANSASKAADELARMNHETATAAAKNITAGFAPFLVEKATLLNRNSDIRAAQAQGHTVAQENIFGLTTTSGRYSQEYKEQGEELQRNITRIAAIDRMQQDMLARAKRAKNDLAGGAPPGSTDDAAKNVYTGDGLGKVKKDPLAKWREFIVSENEKAFRLKNSQDELLDVHAQIERERMVQQAAQLTHEIDLIKLATKVTQDYAAAKEKADANKSFTSEMTKIADAMQKLNHLSAGEQARFDVKHDEEKKSWNPEQVRKFIGGADALSMFTGLIASTKAFGASIAETYQVWFDKQKEAEQNEIDFERELKQSNQDEINRKHQAGYDALSSSILDLRKAQVFTAGFGKEMTAQMYTEMAALDIFGQSLGELDLMYQVLAMAVGRYKKALADKSAEDAQQDTVSTLQAELDGLTKKYSAFDRFMLSRGKKKSGSGDPAERGLRAEFNTQRDIDALKSIENLRRNASVSAAELGRMKFATDEDKFAFIQFGEIVKKWSPEIQQQIHELYKEMADNRKLTEAQRKWDTVAQGLQDAFSYAFDSVLTAHENFGKVFMQQLKSMLARMVAEIAAKNIVGVLAKLTGLTRPTGSDSGGKSKGGGSDIITNLLGLAHSFHLFGRGGRPQIGMPAIVGDKGPELFIPDRAGTIVPNSALGAAGGGNVEVTVTGDHHYYTTVDIEQANRDLARRIVRKLRLA